MEPSFQPHRLTEIRKARGLNSASALGRLLQKSPSAVSRWEKGGNVPDHETLEKLCDIFGVPPKYFWDTSDLGKGTLFFRSNSNLSRTDASVQSTHLSWLSKITEVAEYYVDLPVWKIRLTSSSENFLSLTDEAIENAAVETREYFGLDDAPIDDILTVLEKNGVRLGNTISSHSKMDGVSTWNQNSSVPLVLIDRSKANHYRQQMSVAHELGHLILHSSVNQSDIDGEALNIIEKQAWKFAGAFLMPHSLFPSTIRSLQLDNLVHDKIYWNVSVAGMIMRLSHLSIISDDTKTRLYKNLSARGWRKREPYDELAPAKPPRILSEALDLVVNTGTRTAKQLADSDIILNSEDISLLIGRKSKWLQNLDTLHASGKTSTAQTADNILNFSPANKKSGLPR